MPPLVLLSRGTGLNPAAVGAVLLPAGVVVGALLSLGAPQDGTCTGRTACGLEMNQAIEATQRGLFTTFSFSVTMSNNGILQERTEEPATEMNIL